MTRHSSNAVSDDGFTLIEVLVTLTLLAAIVAIIAPTLFSQLDTGDSTQLRGDLQNVANGVKTFRVDVSPTFPGDVEDLVNEIESGGSSDDASLTGDNYTSGEVERWNGPYVEIQANSSSSASFSTAFGGTVGDDLIDGSSSTDASAVTGSDKSGWVIVEVTGLTDNALTTVDDEFDDGSSSTGRFRHNETDTLWYLATQK